MTGSQQPPSPWGPSGSPQPQSFAALLDAPHRQRRMQALARGMDLYLQIEDLAGEWLDRVCGPELSRHEAMLGLVAGLRGALDIPPGSPPSRL